MWDETDVPLVLAEDHQSRSAMNTYLVMITFRVWFFEIAVSGFNYFVLMNRVYEPRVGKLRAHRVGMTTRIVYISLFVYALVRCADIESVPEMLLAGLIVGLACLAIT